MNCPAKIQREQRKVKMQIIECQNDKICKKGGISDIFGWFSDIVRFLHEKEQMLGMSDFGSFRGACGARATNFSN